MNQLITHPFKRTHPHKRHQQQQQQQQLQPSLLNLVHQSHNYSTQLQSTDLIQIYHSQLTLGKLKQDQYQTRAIYKLQPIHQAIKSYIPHPKLLSLFDRALLSPISSTPLSSAHTDPTSSHHLDHLADNTQLIKIFNQTQHSADQHAPLGFLLTGPPGTGKTLIMDLFFDSLPVHQKFRRHYHHFLLSLYSLVSQRLEQSNSSIEHAAETLSLKFQPSGYLPPKRDRARNKALAQGWRSVFAGGNDPKDPFLNGPNFVLAQVARDLILKQGWILAFDEVQMVDVAGAGILSRVLEWYWRLGGVIIGTSNRVPEHMYDQGVHKSTVAPFLDRLKTKSPVIPLDSPTDWRTKLSSGSNVTQVAHWYQKVNCETWNELVCSHVPSPVQTELVVYGRKVVIGRSDPTIRSAIFTYQELCETALGPADYLKICSSFETILIEGLPTFTPLMKNEARRLITFVDAAYECSVKLYVHSKTSIDKLFFPDDLDSKDTTDVIERETLADMMEELSEPFRPNISDYSRGVKKSIRDPIDTDTRKEIKSDTSSHKSVDQLAIFSGKDEKYAFDRAVSRLRELTLSGGRISKSWSPIEMNLNSDSVTMKESEGKSVKVHQQDQPHDLSNEKILNQSNHLIEDLESHQRFNDEGGRNSSSTIGFFKSPQISPVHFWGIAKWGKRAGRWGQGVEAFNKKKK